MKTLPLLIVGAMTACAAAWSMIPLDGPIPTATAAVKKTPEPLQLPAGMTKNDRKGIEYFMGIWPATVSASIPDEPRFLDGDTFDLMAKEYGRSWTVLKVRIRVKNINAPEVRSPKCAAEKQRAVMATDFVVRTLTAPGAVIEITDKDEFDKDGRYLARVLVNGKDLGEMMMAHNPPLAREWTDEYEGQQKTFWCTSQASATPRR